MKSRLFENGIKIGMSITWKCYCNYVLVISITITSQVCCWSVGLITSQLELGHKKGKKCKKQVNCKSQSNCSSKLTKTYWTTSKQCEVIFINTRSNNKTFRWRRIFFIRGGGELRRKKLENGSFKWKMLLKESSISTKIGQKSSFPSQFGWIYLVCCSHWTNFQVKTF